MRFFITLLLTVSFHSLAMADDIGNWNFFPEDESQNRSNGEATNPFSGFFGYSKEKNRNESLGKISKKRLQRYRKTLQKNYDPHNIVPDRCVVRNETIQTKTGKIMRHSGGGYRHFMHRMEFRGKRKNNISKSQRKRNKKQMLRCDDNLNQVAKKINVIVDKAGKDNRQDRGRKQTMSVYITFANGEREQWEGLPISSGSNHFANSDPDATKADFETPAGTFHLNHFGPKPEGVFPETDDVETTQGYCVRSKNSSYGFPMPNAVRIKCGIFFHSGQFNGVTGTPASHGCVRMKFDHSHKFHCLMRQRGMGAYSDTNHRRTTVHVLKDASKVNPEDLEAAKWNTTVVPRSNKKQTCGEQPLELNPSQQ